MSKEYLFLILTVLAAIREYHKRRFKYCHNLNEFDTISVPDNNNIILLKLNYIFLVFVFIKFHSKYAL